MRRLIALAACSVLLVASGCGGADDDESPTRQTAAELVKADVGDETKEVTCVELAQARYFRCEVADSSGAEFYDAIVSKDGKAVSTTQR